MAMSNLSGQIIDLDTISLALRDQGEDFAASAVSRTKCNT
jgi:hypothetical protein